MLTYSNLTTEIIHSLYLKNRNFCSQDNDECLDFLSKVLPFEIHEYENSFNYWQIPPRWDLKHAFIKDANQKVIFTADHPLKVIGLSKPFSGTMPREQLLKHLYYDRRFEKAIPYHFRQFYRPWERDWGFCVPKTFYDSLDDGDYYVSIDTDETKGSLKVAEYIKKGQSPYGFAFVAHLDHPGMVNDDLAGVAIGVELFKWLESKNTKFSYRLLLVPEIIGSEYFLGHLQTDAREQILESCFLEMLVSNTKLGLQRSLSARSQLEKVIRSTLDTEKISYHEGSFKSIICNDEYIWEGYQIPMCSLSRFPYKEYHTHLDNLSIISQQSIKESLNLLQQVVDRLEKLTLIEKRFSGTPCLSNPTLNLYVDPGQRAFGTHQGQGVQRNRLLSDLIPTEKKVFF